MKSAGPLLGAGLMVPALLVLWTAHQPSASAQAAARFTGFPASVRSYLDLRSKVKARLPAVSNRAEAAQLARNRQQLAEALKSARPNARQGDIFTPAVAADFKQVLRMQTAKSARKAIREGNPSTEGNPAAIKMEVNAQYPVDQPVSLVPPTILLKLPELPKELKYCFVGDNLLLLDVESNLIVDYIPEATT